MIKAMADKFKSIRIKAGLQQKELAQLSGITPNALSQIEIGNKGTTVKTAKAICDALGAQFDDLFELVQNERR